MKQAIRSTAIATLLLVMSVCASADVAVVVNTANNSDFDASQIRLIFLGKKKAFSNGDTLDMYDLPEDDHNRLLFAKKVLRKNPARLNSYWARMLFSSKGNPPKTMSDAEAVKNIVANNQHAIAYINTDDVDGSVKVVYTFTE